MASARAIPGKLEQLELTETVDWMGIVGTLRFAVCQQSLFLQSYFHPPHLPSSSHIPPLALSLFFAFFGSPLPFLALLLSGLLSTSFGGQLMCAAHRCTPSILPAVNGG